MGQGNVNAGVASVRRAEGFVAGATPLLTGTLSSHPSNRTVYSGLKLPRTQSDTHGSAWYGNGVVGEGRMGWLGEKVGGVRKNGEWERRGRMKHEVVKKKTWDGGEIRGWDKVL